MKGKRTVLATAIPVAALVLASWLPVAPALFGISLLPGNAVVDRGYQYKHLGLGERKILQGLTDRQCSDTCQKTSSCFAWTSFADKQCVLRLSTCCTIKLPKDGAVSGKPTKVKDHVTVCVGAVGNVWDKIANGIRKFGQTTNIQTIVQLGQNLAANKQKVLGDLRNRLVKAGLVTKATVLASLQDTINAVLAAASVPSTGLLSKAKQAVAGVFDAVALTKFGGKCY